MAILEYRQSFRTFIADACKPRLHIYEYDIYTEVIIAFRQLELHMACLSNT